MMQFTKRLGIFLASSLAATFLQGAPLAFAAESIEVDDVRDIQIIHAEGDAVDTASVVWEWEGDAATRVDIQRLVDDTWVDETSSLRARTEMYKLDYDFGNTPLQMRVRTHKKDQTSDWEEVATPSRRGVSGLPEVPPTYAETVLAHNPTAFYPMDSANCRVDALGGLDFTYDPTFTSGAAADAVSCLKGSLLGNNAGSSMDGSRFVRNPSSTEYTYEFWAASKPTLRPSYSDKTLMQATVGTTPWRIMYDSTYKELQQNYNGQKTRLASVFSADYRYHIVITRASGVYTTYVNGVKAASLTAGAVSALNFDLRDFTISNFASYDYSFAYGTAKKHYESSFRGNVPPTDISATSTIWGSYDATSDRMAISDNGKYVFYSTTQGTSSTVIHRKNLQTSVDKIVAQIPGISTANSSLAEAANGRYVAYFTGSGYQATGITSVDVDSGASTTFTGIPTGARLDDKNFELSGDGRYITFAYSLNNFTYIARLDRLFPATLDQITAPRDTWVAGSAVLDTSPDGRFVLFTDRDNNDGHKTEGQCTTYGSPVQLWRLDRGMPDATGAFTATPVWRVASSTFSGQWSCEGGIRETAAISADGSQIVFQTGDPGLTAGMSDGGSVTSIVVKDMNTNTLSPVGILPNGNAIAPKVGFPELSMSSDGRFVAFSSTIGAHTFGNGTRESLLVVDRRPSVDTAGPEQALPFGAETRLWETRPTLSTGVISTESYFHPVLSRDGTTLIYDHGGPVAAVLRNIPKNTPSLEQSCAANSEGKAVVGARLGLPANLGLGCSFWATTDGSLPSQGVALSLDRGYTSRDKLVVGSMGRGWRAPYSYLATQYELEKEDVHTSFSITNPNGRIDVYHWDNDRKQYAPAWGTNTSAHVEATFNSAGKAVVVNLKERDGSYISFNANGRPTSMFDAYGNGLSLVWSGTLPNDKLSTITDNAGQTAVFHYDNTSFPYLLTSISTPVWTTLYTYDETGSLLLSAKDALGITTSYTYDAFNTLNSITGPDGHVDQSVQYTSGNSLSITDSLGNVGTASWTNSQDATATFNGYTWHEYQAINSDDNKSSITDPYGNTTVSSDRFTKDAKGNTWDTTWAESDPPVSLGFGTQSTRTATDPLGNSVQYDYKDTGQLREMRVYSKGEGNDDYAETRYQVSLKNELTQVIYESGRVVQYTYDTDGNLTQKDDSAGGIEEYTYTSRGLLKDVSTQNEDGVVSKTSFTYNARGDILEVVEPLGQTNASYKTVYTYDTSGRVLTTKSAGAPTTTYTYDIRNRVKTSATNGKTTTYAYFPDDSLSSVSEGNKTTSFTKEYNTTGLLTTTTSPDNEVSSEQLDAMGRLVATTDTAGRTTSYVYDVNSNLLRVIDPVAVAAGPNASAASFTYDILNRVRTITERGSGSVEYKYTGMKVARVKDSLSAGYGDLVYEYYNSLDVRSIMREGGALNANGYRTLYTYDDGRLAQKDFYATGIGVSPFTWTYGYDENNGLLNSESVPSGGLEVSTRSVDMTQYAYDKNARLTSATSPAGNETFAYTPANQVATYGFSSNSNTFQENYTYNTDLLLKSTTRTGFPNSQVESYDYDANDNLTAWCLSVTCSSSNAASSWQYSPGGRRLSETNSAGTSTYNYAPNGDLTSLTKPDGSSAGNYTYDAAGFTTYDPEESRAYTWTGLGAVDSQVEAGLVTNYTYDGLGYLNVSQSNTDHLLLTDYLDGSSLGQGALDGELAKLDTTRFSGLTSEVKASGTSYTTRTSSHVNTISGNQVAFSAQYDPLGRRVSETGTAPVNTWGDTTPLSSSSYTSGGGVYAAVSGVMGGSSGMHTPTTYQLDDPTNALLGGPDITFEYSFGRDLKDVAIDLWEGIDPLSGIWTTPYKFRSANHIPYKANKDIGFGVTVALSFITGGTTLGLKGSTKGAAAALKHEGKDDAAEAVLGTTCQINSFAAGTPVLLADGSTKPIEDVRIGDKVIATDPTTGKTSTETVTNLIQGSGTKQMVEVTLADGQVIQATENHPFWDATTKSWTNAGDLTTQSQVETASSQLVAVQSIRAYTLIDTTVYNLTVSGKHTYYVGSAADAVLVHNSTCNSITGSAFVVDSAGVVESLPYIVFNAKTIPHIANSVETAITSGKPGILTRITNKKVINANRRAACKNFCGRPLSPDEYPFASSREGGAGAHILGVPLREQKQQGNALKNFIQEFNIKNGDRYVVFIR